MPLPITPINITANTFREWVETTNAIIDVLNTQAVVVDSEVTGNLIVNGAIIGVSGEFITLETVDLDVLGSSAHNGAATFANTVGITGLATLNTANIGSLLKVNGAATFANTLDVTGLATLNTANIGSVLNVNGASVFANTVDILGALTVNAAVTFNAAATLANTLNVTGLATLNTANVGSLLKVNGAATFANTVDVTGLATLNTANVGSLLKVNGATTFSNTITATNLAAPSGNTYTVFVNENGLLSSGANASGGAAKPFIVFMPTAGIPPTATPMSYDTRGNNHAMLTANGSANNLILFEGALPNSYANGNIEIAIDWVSPNTSGNVVWSCNFERVTGQDIDSDSFATAKTNNSVQTQGTSGIAQTSIITFANTETDGVQAGEPFRILIARLPGETNDNLAGNASIIQVRLREV